MFGWWIMTQISFHRRPQELGYQFIWTFVVGNFLLTALCLHSPVSYIVRRRITCGREWKHFYPMWGFAWTNCSKPAISDKGSAFLFHKYTCIRKIKQFLINKWHFTDGTHCFPVKSAQTMPVVATCLIIVRRLIQ